MKTEGVTAILGNVCAVDCRKAKPYSYLIFLNETTLVTRKQPSTPTLLPYSPPGKNKGIRLRVCGEPSVTKVVSFRKIR